MSSVLWEELEKRRVIDGVVTLRQCTLTKSTNLWKYAFQVGVYRKLLLLNGHPDVSRTARLVVFTPGVPGYVEAVLVLDSISAVVREGEAALTVLEHVDRALQYRARELRKMQRYHEEKGEVVDERTFNK
jgi:hypothetical protein